MLPGARDEVTFAVSLDTRVTGRNQVERICRRSRQDTESQSFFGASDYVSELDRITMSQNVFSDRDIQASYHCRVSSCVINSSTKILVRIGLHLVTIEARMETRLDR